MSSLHPAVVSGLAQTLITGAIAEPTTDPRPVGEQDDVRAARDELGDLGVVVDVGKAEAHFASGTTSRR
jgi:hypothetical protein